MLLPVLKETISDFTRCFELLGPTNQVRLGLVHYGVAQRHLVDAHECRSVLRILPEASGIRGISRIHTNGRRGPNAPTAPAYPFSADELSVACGPNAPMPHNRSDHLRPWVINRLYHTNRSRRPGTNNNVFIVRCPKRHACKRRRRSASRRRISRDNSAKRF